MSQQLINRNADLLQLRQEGYDIEVCRGHLLLKSVPYLDGEGKVRRGTLVCPLTVSGDTTGSPKDHTLFFIGDHPHAAAGRILQGIQNSSKKRTLAPGIEVDHQFSAKPKPEGTYRDYHHKMTAYVGMISGPARQVDPVATAQTNTVAEASEDESPFRYVDSSSTRSGIAAITAKLEGQKIGIVGLGGTGSYVLDLVAKTPVAEIHLFDGDVFANHNAFRAPGAPSVDELRQHPTKVDYLAGIYSRMHRSVHPQNVYLDAESVDALQPMDFVFLCLDRGTDKRIVFDRLTGWGKPFIDVGIGIEPCDNALRGQVRVTSIMPEKRDHLEKRVPFGGGLAENEYASNIQIADINALNAALAVIRWKKFCGFYQDLDREHHCIYTINGNHLSNEDAA